MIADRDYMRDDWDKRKPSAVDERRCNIQNNGNKTSSECDVDTKMGLLILAVIGIPIILVAALMIVMIVKIVIVGG